LKQAFVLLLVHDDPPVVPPLPEFPPLPLPLPPLPELPPPPEQATENTVAPTSARADNRAGIVTNLDELMLTPSLRLIHSTVENRKAPASGQGFSRAARID
jgi:hypothetical protein